MVSVTSSTSSPLFAGDDDAGLRSAATPFSGRAARERTPLVNAPPPPPGPG
ncbi:hypothetical protein B005_0038 [Nocardiopsis alba ATCC BAA-2165]|uniref:Uncharacterized protein n=1 Tax=Nocardiopsis alba (strain ATCC BAA-2165 / BE74) TaxID=1205910 RepID=J7LJK4_NOCAA|nr:hypothetical protein B005_0038 [Nocardiopsis alba ATCC BAA-2165]